MKSCADMLFFPIRMSQVLRKKKKAENEAVTFIGVFCALPVMLLMSMAWKCPFCFWVSLQTANFKNALSVPTTL